MSIVITNKFKELVINSGIFNGSAILYYLNTDRQYHSYNKIKVEGGGLWLLIDDKTRKEIGILDAGSFLEAVMDSDLNGVVLSGMRN